MADGTGFRAKNKSFVMKCDKLYIAKEITTLSNRVVLLGGSWAKMRKPLRR